MVFAIKKEGPDLVQVINSWSRHSIEYVKAQESGHCKSRDVVAQLEISTTGTLVWL